MAGFLLDTDTVSELSKQSPNRNVCARFQVRQTSCALAATTIEELIYGIERMAISVRRQTLETWFSGLPNSFDVLAFDAPCAEWLGRERARLDSLGWTPSRSDGQIAAVAVINDLTLVTRNTSDFARLSGLRVENWFED